MNYEKRIALLEKQIKQMNQKWWKKFIKKSHFLIGITLGFLLSSIISYAVFNVTYSNFEGGTPISANEMNKNFEDIETKITAIETRFNTGFYANIPTVQTVTDGTYQQINFNSIAGESLSSGQYTVSVTGTYEIFAYLGAEINKKIFVNNVEATALGGNLYTLIIGDFVEIRGRYFSAGSTDTDNTMYWNMMLEYY